MNLNRWSGGPTCVAWESFIEVMPLGEIETARIDQHLSLMKVRAQLARRFSLQETDYHTGGPARYVRVGETAA